MAPPAHAATPLLAHRTSPRTTLRNAEAAPSHHAFSWPGAVHALALLWIVFMIAHTVSIGGGGGAVR